MLGSIALVVKGGDPPSVGAHSPDFDPALDLRAREAAFEARIRLEAARRNLKPVGGRSGSSLEELAPPPEKPPAPSSSGALLALPGPGYLFDDLVRGGRDRGN